jgi:2-C-methyl-D-erythritol 2,4-cyclodiphosphate synthase
MIRIGQGYDLHRITSGRALVLGGVRIPWDRGLLGHSDADVLIHAVIDALLGALALGDIGQWFPDRDHAYRDIPSSELLGSVLSDPRVAAWQVVNLDATVVTEAPRLADHMTAIRDNLAELIGIDVDRISVKAKTGEGVDAVGRSEAMEAYAVVLLCGGRADGQAPSPTHAKCQMPVRTRILRS